MHTAPLILSRTTLLVSLALVIAALTGCDTPTTPTPTRPLPPTRTPPPTPTTTRPIAPAGSQSYVPANLTPPPVAREFRAAWISSVGENSWLNGLTGKSTAEQKAALLAMIERAAQLKLNAVIFQVRPSCDALYASSIEPWC